MKHVMYTQNNKLNWLPKHVPFCFGLCSNIPGYKEPYVYINDNMDKLVDNMISYLNEMSTKSKLLCEEKLASVFTELNCKEQQWKDLLDKCEEYLKHNDSNESDDNITNFDDNTQDSVSAEYDVQSQCIMYKLSTITNFGVYNTFKKKVNW